MNGDRHDQSEINDFETRIRSLVPRPPLALEPLVEEESEAIQVAGGRHWWSTNTEASRAYYRTIGLSASLGALFGAACTLLLLRWSGVPDQPHTPSVATLPDEAGDVSGRQQDSVVEPDGGSSIVQVESQPQNPRQRMNSSAGLPYDWLENLRSLKPGTLEVGTLLVSRQATRHRGARNEATFESARISSDESSRIIADASYDSSRVELGTQPLPQREWMQLMLNSPNEFF